MKLQFTHPMWLIVLPFAVGWVLWLFARSDVHIAKWRRWAALAARLTVVTLLVCSIAGLQWLKAMEGMNVFYVVDRSDSVPSTQQEEAREYVNQSFKNRKTGDRAGVLVFGTDAALESAANPVVDVQKIHAVVGSERTDLAAAIRLGTAAFPETGQRRMVLITDGNENVGDAMTAVLAAKPLGVTFDVVPVGGMRGNDASIQKLSLPNNLKKGQTFEVKIFAQADQAQTATVRLFRNDQHLDSQQVQLAAGKNLFSFPQTLDAPGFYSYDIQLEATGDQLPQNNRAVNFTYVRGDPTILLISSDPAADAPLAEALRQSRLDVKLISEKQFPATLAEMQVYDAIFLSNIAAGDLGMDLMRLLESAVRDFGVGLVCIGGDQAYAAGGYRDTPLDTMLPVNMELSSKKVLPSGALVLVCIGGDQAYAASGYRHTPLETMLPVNMDLSSKKVLPSGALVLVVHATEFPNGNQWARDIAFAALQSLGPQDQMGIVLWDGTDRWLFPLQKVGNRKEIGKMIAGMNPGDMGSFIKVMEMAHEALKKSNSSLKHMVVFSDGDPTAPSKEEVAAIVRDKITISTVMIGGHVSPDTMEFMATDGRGRFYDVRSPAALPQIFIKEAAVILKSAIFEEPFTPQQVGGSEVLRGISAGELPRLLGYVATTPKARAETPLVSEKGDPILAHWQYGLGRAMAFTSDARAKWSQQWLGWGKYRQFWSQAAQWSLRKVDNADFNTDITVDKGEGQISVEALDGAGNFRNFLNLEAVVVSPKGERVTAQLQQTGPGHYEAKFPTKEVGAYLINLLDKKDGKLQGSQVLGASVNYSPEFNAVEPNLNLLQRITEAGGGRMLNLAVPGMNPFEVGRKKTFQPRDLWELLLQLAIVLFLIDVAIRRIQIDRAEWLKATENLRRMIFFWKGIPRAAEADESLGALLARRDAVRARTAPRVEPNPDLFRPATVVSESAAPTPKTAAAPATASTAEPSGTSPAPAPVSSASRLLEAKRRALKK